MTDRLIDSRLPLVAAPMAGGPTTVELATAVADAGAFPFLAGGYKSPAALRAEIEQLRGLDTGFGVNLFVPSRAAVDEVSFAAYARELAAEAAAYGIALNEVPVVDDDDRWAEKLVLLLASPVPVVSLTFGLPDPTAIAALRAVGTRVIASVTTTQEARRARDAGVDGLVVQGSGAGGHSAVFDPARTPENVDTADLAGLTDLADLVREVRGSVRLPVIAAGGVDGPAAVEHLIDAGAEAVAVGTLLLLADEAGTSAAHRSALADPAYAETVVTRAFTGRPARALRNGFIDRHGRSQVTAYPAVHHLTRPLRQAAAKAGDPERLHLWAGTGYRSAATGPAADIVRRLASGL